MQKDKINILIQKYREGTLDLAEEQLLEACIEKGEIALEELTDLQQLNTRMNQVFAAEPSPALRQQFYQMVTAEKAVLGPVAKENHFLQKILDQLFFKRLAYSLGLIAIGFGVGYFFHSDQEYKNQLANLSGELTEMREMMMLGMLDKASTSERLKAVSLTQDMRQVSNKVADALLKTLNHDDNVNVRLLTLEALYPYANDPKVREGLIKAIPQQDSPLVQMALAEVMVALQEKRSIEALRSLMSKEETLKEAREKIQNSIDILL